MAWVALAVQLLAAIAVTDLVFDGSERPWLWRRLAVACWLIAVRRCLVLMGLAWRHEPLLLLSDACALAASLVLLELAITARHHRTARLAGG